MTARNLYPYDGLDAARHGAMCDLIDGLLATQFHAARVEAELVGRWVLDHHPTPKETARHYYEQALAARDQAP